VPELAALASLCVALVSLPHAAARPLLAGAMFGAGLGGAFLSAMWTLPAGLAGAVLLAHAVSREWRTRRGIAFLAVAAAVALVVALPWPLVLANRSAPAFLEWTQANWRPQGTILANLRHFFATASWFCWPAWPLALWAAWSLRRAWREPRVLVPAATVVLMLSLYGAWGPRQDETLLGVLAPLSLLGAQGIFSLRRGAMAALDWFGALTFGVFTALVWVGYSAMLFGLPAPVARNFGRMAPGFAAELRPFAMVVAVMLAAAWLYLMFFTRSSPMRSIARWALGVVLLWGTFAMLWMPWADYQRSYRGVALALRIKVPTGARCVALRNVGVSQAAAFDYHGAIRGPAYDPQKPGACPLVLVQGAPAHELDAPARAPGGRWVKVADVGRPGDRAERYRLYRLTR
jgi:4-amino-4-deoxy-L-arabinose transferase-like glycosyltransferase